MAFWDNWFNRKSNKTRNNITYDKNELYGKSASPGREGTSVSGKSGQSRETPLTQSLSTKPLSSTHKIDISPKLRKEFNSSLGIFSFNFSAKSKAKRLIIWKNTAIEEMKKNDEASKNKSRQITHLIEEYTNTRKNEKVKNIYDDLIKKDSSTIEYNYKVVPKEKTVSPDLSSTSQKVSGIRQSQQSSPTSPPSAIMRQDVRGSSKSDPNKTPQQQELRQNSNYRNKPSPIPTPDEEKLKKPVETYNRLNEEKIKLEDEYRNKRIHAKELLLQYYQSDEYNNIKDHAKELLLRYYKLSQTEEGKISAESIFMGPLYASFKTEEKNSIELNSKLNETINQISELYKNNPGLEEYIKKTEVRAEEASQTKEEAVAKNSEALVSTEKEDRKNILNQYEQLKKEHKEKTAALEQEHEKSGSEEKSDRASHTAESEEFAIPKITSTHIRLATIESNIDTLLRNNPWLRDTDQSMTGPNVIPASTSGSSVVSGQPEAAPLPANRDSQGLVASTSVTASANAAAANSSPTPVISKPPESLAGTLTSSSLSPEIEAEYDNILTQLAAIVPQKPAASTPIGNGNQNTTRTDNDNQALDDLLKELDKLDKITGSTGAPHSDDSTKQSLDELIASLEEQERSSNSKAPSVEAARTASSAPQPPLLNNKSKKQSDPIKELNAALNAIQQQRDKLLLQATNSTPSSNSPRPFLEAHAATLTDKKDHTPKPAEKASPSASVAVSDAAKIQTEKPDNSPNSPLKP